MLNTTISARIQKSEELVNDAVMNMEKTSLNESTYPAKEVVINFINCFMILLYLKSMRLSFVFQILSVHAEVEALKQISKLNSVKSCHELKQYGVNVSKYYDVDPDGELSGHLPIR